MLNGMRDVSKELAQLRSESLKANEKLKRALELAVGTAQAHRHLSYSLNSHFVSDSDAIWRSRLSADLMPPEIQDQASVGVNGGSMLMSLQEDVLWVYLFTDNACFRFLPNMTQYAPVSPAAAETVVNVWLDELIEVMKLRFANKPACLRAGNPFSDSLD
jgi:hypothetical protein